MRNSVNQETWKIITAKQSSSDYTRTYLTCTEIKMSLTPRIVSGMSIITAYILQQIFLQSVIHQNLFTAFGLNCSFVNHFIQKSIQLIACYETVQGTAESNKLTLLSHNCTKHCHRMMQCLKAAKFTYKSDYRI